MTKRINLHVSMELLSDTIFGSGYSIPGGEDIAVCRDKMGYPYLKGSTFKGLLRESLQNWLVWTSGSYDELNALMGESDWSAPAGERRINVTPLCLLDPPAEPESCYINRTFTSLENGIVKQGTLRVASCIHAGLCFHGDMECAEDDAELIRYALTGIKWVGTMRNRGFGHVRITSEIAPGKQGFPEISRASCIRYRLLAQSPILITNLNRSRGNAFESRAYIPGSAIRGMVTSSLAEASPKVFETIRSLQPCVLSAKIPDSTHNPIFACLYYSLCGIKQGRKSRGMTVGSFLVVQWKDSERGILRNSRPKQSLTLCFFVDK